MPRFFTMLLVVVVAVWLLRKVLPALNSSAGGGWSIDFQDGQVRDSSGAIPRTVYNALEDVASMTATEGRVSCDGHDVRFSRKIPDGAQQQFRNAWLASRPRG